MPRKKAEKEQPKVEKVKEEVKKIPEAKPKIKSEPPRVIAGKKMDFSIKKRNFLSPKMSMDIYRAPSKSSINIVGRAIPGEKYEYLGVTKVLQGSFYEIKTTSYSPVQYISADGQFDFS